ncbi:MAG: 8-oxoguanine DNA glycosylase [Armatimonadota bacterium]|nr:MAG: 8-oxoguanine DNA glycosylase [Armatimonadota bacterium]
MSGSDVSFSIPIAPGSLDLDRTFASGQVFRWKRLGAQDWAGPLGGDAVRLTLASQDLLTVWLSRDEPARAEVERFLRLEVDLAAICEDLRRRDARLGPLLDAHQGLRVLRQDPVECLLSFVCAVVTNIPRISMSLEEVCRVFGRRTALGLRIWPDLETLAAARPEDLRLGGLEFRCRSLSRAAQALRERGGAKYLENIRELPYEDAFAELLTLPHVGPKIADCVLLFALGFDEAFPLDTHTWRAVQRLYGETGIRRTPRGYREMSRLLRERLGPWAGWAQQYLFYDSLASRRARPPEDSGFSR